MKPRNMNYVIDWENLFFFIENTSKNIVTQLYDLQEKIFVKCFYDYFE